MQYEEERINDLRTINLMGAVESLDGSAKNLINRENCCDLFILNIWEPWCRPCVLEIPELNQVKEEYSTLNVAFVGLTRFPQLALDQLKQEQNIEYEFLQLSFFQPHEQSPFFAINPYQQKTIPATIILDSEGNVLEYLIGYSEENIKKVL